MKKHDVKAIFLIFIILLLISAIAIYGITTYVKIMNSQGNEDKYALFEGNTTTLPTANENGNTLVTPMENEVGNQTPVDTNENQNTSVNEPITNQIQNTPSNTQTNNNTHNNSSNNNNNNKGSNTSTNTSNNNQSSNSQSNTNTNNNTIQNTPSNVTTGKQEYYYKQLNSYSKIIYDTLKNNKDNLKTGTYKIDFGDKFSELLSQENGSDLLQDYYQAAMETYLYDNPDVFYLEPTKMYINIQTTKKLFTTTYEVFINSGDYENYLAEGFTHAKILEYEKQINTEVQKILQNINGVNDYLKILAVHNYLVENVSYEQTISKANIYNIYGALVNKECVCEGYAKAFKYLLNQLGIESIVVIGNATDSEGKTQNHAWNYVQLKNVWYAVDVTWDDPIIIGGGTATTEHKYKYFLKGSQTINQDHILSNTFVNNGKQYTHPTLSVTDYKK